MGFKRIFFAGLLSLKCLMADPFISYEFSGGRFGDCLLCYLHAKWLSYQHQIPLLYKPFPYSKELKLDEKEAHFQPFYPVVSLERWPLDPKRKRVIYSSPFFPEDPSDRWIRPNGYRFDVDWKNKEFKKMAREMIAPKTPLSLIVPPKETTNVALHIREGGGYDTDHTRLWDPLKLPPLHFYIEGLRKVAQLFPDRPLYCYLFTDALEPALLASEMKRGVVGLPIEIEYRKENNHHQANVLEDFFSFFHFDVLIHPQSNYSVVAAGIGEFAVTYSPTNFIREGTQITITEGKLEIDEILFKQILDKK